MIDVSGYDDSQELVNACDLLISDYSSIMFEAALTGKPVLLFAPDKEQYIGEERELYIDYGALPFPIAETNAELWSMIGDFNYEAYKRKVASFLQQYGVHEDGHASERAAEFIMELVTHRHKISIIIPIYNTAPYLPRCIESVTNQTYRDLEIILVDDGSTDNSGQICEEYAKKDSRIIFVRQENQGNNAARKAGLDICTGEYVMFVDSDDWIGSNLVSALYQPVEKYQVELVISNVLMTRVNGRKEERKNLIEAGIYTNPKEAVKKLFFDYEDCRYGILPYIYAKLYQKDLVVRSMKRIDDKVQYDEDRALVWTCLMQEIKTAFIDDMEYYYCQRPEGLVCAKDEMYLAKINYFYCYMNRLFAHEDEILRKQMERYVAWNVEIALKWKLGMSEKVRTKMREIYVPDSSAFLMETTSVILYGAGAVGCDYYTQLQESRKIRIAAWIDKAWKERQREGLPVKPIEEAAGLSYEYILVAVKREKIFKEIKEELIAKGLPKERILWGKPYKNRFFTYEGEVRNMINDYNLLKNYETLFKVKRFIIWGAGEKGKELGKILCRYTDKLGFVDTDRAKQGTYCEIPICAPEEVIHNEEEYVIVLSTDNLKIQESILEQIELMGIQYVEVYTWYAMQAVLFFIQNKQHLQKNDIQTNIGKIDANVSNIVYKQTMQEQMFMAAMAEKSVFVYQSKKVGSVTVNSSVRAAGIYGVHVHDFGFLKSEPYFLKDMIRKISGKVISIVREPVARQVSLLWHYWGTAESDFFTENKYRSLDEIEKQFYAIPNMEDEFEWYLKEFKDILNINIYEYPFNKEQGYSIIEKDGISLLLLKTESLNDLGFVIGRFLGLEKFELTGKNIAKRKNINMHIRII